MAETIYICTEEQSNKFWSYEIDGDNIVTKWGRVGFPNPQSNTKPYVARELEKLIASKVKKGYKEVTKQKLSEETESALELGAQYKIKTLKWVRRKDASTFHRLDKYDPKHYVLVEILNSWKKDITRLVLSKEETLEIHGGITEAGEEILINGLSQLSMSHKFASAVRSRLKKMSETVVQVLKKVSFAALGRNLFGEEDAEEISESPSYQEEIAKIDSSGFDSSVINTFAAMGRALDF